MDKSPETVAVIVAFAVLFGTRLIDFFIPKGTVFKWFGKYGTKQQRNEWREIDGDRRSGDDSNYHGPERRKRKG